MARCSVTRTAPSLVASPWATLRTDAPSTAIARTILRWLTGNTARCRSTSHAEHRPRQAGESTISTQSSRGRSTRRRVSRSALAHEVDELVTSDRVQPWQERACRIPGMPLAVEAYEYLLHQIFNLMRTEAHANETRRKRSTQGSRNFFEHALICDGFAAAARRAWPLPSAALALPWSSIRLSLPPILQIGPRIRSSDQTRVSRLRKLYFVRRTYWSALLHFLGFSKS